MISYYEFNDLEIVYTFDDLKISTNDETFKNMLISFIKHYPVVYKKSRFCICHTHMMSGKYQFTLYDFTCTNPFGFLCSSASIDHLKNTIDKLLNNS